MDNEAANLQISLNTTMGTSLTQGVSFELFRRSLIEYLQQLIDYDLEKLIFLLYKVDVDENKLKSLIAGAADAGETIADLIIERQMQKIRSRETFRSNGNINEEEKW